MTQKYQLLLEQLGFKSVLATVLDCMIRQNKKPLSAHEIEIETELRQPQVSIALGQIVEKKWAKKSERPVEKGKSGRPELEFTLLSDKVYADIEKDQQKDISNRHEILEKLKSAMISPKPVVSEQPSTEGNS